MIDVYVDFETHYDEASGYTLKKMPTAQYVRDDRFECQGCAVAIPSMGVRAWLPDPKPLFDVLPWHDVRLWAHNCVPGDTEVLTPLGWKFISEVTKADCVMQWDPNTEIMSWAQVLATVSGRADSTIGWETNFHAGEYTRDHRVFFSTPDVDDWRCETAQSVAQRSPNNTYVPASGYYVGGEDLFSASQARLIEAIRADGSFTHGRYVRFSLKKQRKIDRLKQLLGECGLPFSETRNARGVTIIRVRAHPLVSRFIEFLTPAKRYTTESLLSLSLRLRSAIFDEAKHWDGAAHTKTSNRWFTADPSTAEAFQTCGPLSGWRVTGAWRANDRGFSAASPGHVFIATMKETTRSKLVTKGEYRAGERDVYCLTVPSGAFIVRRKGRVWMTGNCQFDGLVLTERFRHFPAEYACTMFMARYLISQGLVDPALGTSLEALAPLVGMEKGDLDEAHEAGTLDEYALLDLDILVALAEKYWPIVPEDERRYIDVHVRMATEPVFDLAVSELQAIADKDKSVEELFPLVRKDDKFVAALRALGVQVEYKTTAKGNMKPALAKTDKFMQKILGHDDPRVVLLAETRQRAKSTIHRSRAQRFMDVGAPLPAPILYYGAGTGRGSGLDKLNMQNLPKKGGLRQCIRAPRFHKFVIVDSSQVEVRVNAWLAGQEDLLEDFRQGRDPYLGFAEFLYDVPYEALVERHKGGDPDTADKRQVAKAAVLALGFMQGAFGFLAYCEGFGIPMDEPTAKRVVDAYRARYQKIVAHARQTYIEVRDTTQQVLPSGRLLTYPGIHAEGRDLYYRRPRIFSKSAGMDRVKLWPGITVENCLGADTEVLTCQGWLPLYRVSCEHKVFDGLDWVRHRGVVYQGDRWTHSFGGVHMTFDHKVLTDRGFLPMGQTTHEDACGYFQRLHGDEARYDDRGSRSWVQRTAKTVAGTLRVWRRKDSSRHFLRDWRRTVLQFFGVSEGTPPPEGAQTLYNAWDVEAPRLRGLAVYAGQVPAADAPSVAQLWGAGDSRLRSLGRVVREFLGGYGSDLPTGSHPGAGEQRRRVWPVELQVGGLEVTVPQPTPQRSDRHARGADAGVRGGREIRYRNDDAIISQGGGGSRREDVRPPRLYQSVYDILNAGPRHRFVVRGTDGRPFIVSNCVQAAARDAVFGQQVLLTDMGYKVALMVHDESLLVVPEEKAERAKHDAERAFATPPVWAPDMPLAGEARITDFYTK